MTFVSSFLNTKSQFEKKTVKTEKYVQQVMVRDLALYGQFMWNKKIEKV